MSIVPKSDPKPSTFNVSSPQVIQKSRTLTPVKKLVPDPELMNLADDIRSLGSDQIEGEFTHGDGERCVMGALAVEKYGALDNYNAIVDRIQNTPILRAYWDRLATLNNSGHSFKEIANWVEGHAKALGRWI